MVEFISEYKWLFFIVGEIIFWGSVIGFLLVRYLFNLEKLSKYLIVIWLVSDIWLLMIGIIDYRNTGEFDTFQVVITAFLIYALTFGKNDFKKLDRFIKRTIKKLKGEPLEPEDFSEQQYGMKHAVHQLKGLVIHVLLYAAVIFVLSLNMPFRDFSTLFSSEGTGDTIDNLVRNGLFEHRVAAQVTGIWTLVVIIDILITLSYFIFPKTEKKKQKNSWF
ncbi:hypothetical protein [Alkalihalobacillus sp. TS-13]|uniref:hypothetical protein n=1 Tax=Alkalihalobacillus sp. TS-13 TaxID=2842455 RepID=UPI001C88155C|nr:hypothetical protein [Alkalihalobacillus sp. TS-13]